MSTYLMLLTELYSNYKMATRTSLTLNKLSTSQLVVSFWLGTDYNTTIRDVTTEVLSLKRLRAEVVMDTGGYSVAQDRFFRDLFEICRPRRACLPPVSLESRLN